MQDWAKGEDEPQCLLNWGFSWSMWSSGAEMTLLGCHKLCLGAMHSTPHWPVIEGGLPPGRGHTLWEREVLREGLRWDPSATNPPCSWAMCVSSWRAPGKYSTTFTTLTSNPLSRPQAHIHHRLTTKPILTLYSLPLHTWDMGVTPTRHFQMPLALSLSSGVTKLKMYYLVPLLKIPVNVENEKFILP